MNVSTNNLPGRLRCEADMHRAQIQIKPRRTAGSLITIGMVLLLNTVLLAIGLRQNELAMWSMITILGVPFCAAILLMQLKYQKIFIELDPHVVTVRKKWLGPSHRIPLMDIQSVTLHKIGLKAGRQGLLELTLENDTIFVGHQVDRLELLWLRNLLVSTINVAKQRPEKRDGTPEEVPQALSAITNAKTVT